MTDPLTYLDEVDARVAAATEGPWVEANGTVMHSTFYGLAPVTGNAEFIAHSRSDVPRMSKALRAVLAVIQHDARVEALNDSISINRIADLVARPTATDYMQAIQTALAVNDEGGTK